MEHYNARNPSETPPKAHFQAVMGVEEYNQVRPPFTHEAIVSFVVILSFAVKVVEIDEMYSLI